MRDDIKHLTIGTLPAMPQRQLTSNVARNGAAKQLQPVTAHPGAVHVVANDDNTKTLNAGISKTMARQPSDDSISHFHLTPTVGKRLTPVTPHPHQNNHTGGASMKHRAKHVDGMDASVLNASGKDLPGNDIAGNFIRAKTGK